MFSERYCAGRGPLRFVPGPDLVSDSDALWPVASWLLEHCSTGTGSHPPAEMALADRWRPVWQMRRGLSVVMASASDREARATRLAPK